MGSIRNAREPEDDGSEAESDDSSGPPSLVESSGRSDDMPPPLVESSGSGNEMPPPVMESSGSGGDRPPPGLADTSSTDSDDDATMQSPARGSVDASR